MNKELSVVRHLASLVLNGEVLLEEGPDNFWLNVRSEVRSSSIGLLGYATAQYNPKYAKSDQKMLGASYGQAFNPHIADYPECVADAVRRAYDQIYSDYFLGVRSIVAHELAMAVGSVGMPNGRQSFAVYTDGLPDMRNKLFALRTAAQMAGNMKLVDTIMMIDLCNTSAGDESKSSMLEFNVPNTYNYRLVQYGPSIVRHSSITDITPVLHFIGDPTSRTVEYADIQAVTIYNNKQTGEQHGV